MSSTFGGGSGNGQIRYAIVIDDAQVNQKLTNFQSTLGRLSTATQSSASQFQGFNSTLQTMDSTVNTAAKDIDAINNNFRSMDSSLQSTSREMGALTNNFKGVEGGLTRSNTLLGQGSEATQTFGQKMKSAGGFVKDNALAIGVATSSVISLISSYTSLQKSQNALEKAQNVEIGMRNKISDLTKKYAQAVKEEGANSQTAIKIGRDLQLLRNKQSTQLEKISIMQQQLNEKTGQTFTQAINDSILFGSSITQIAGTIAANSGRITKAVGGIKGAFAGISAAALIELGPVLGLIKSIEVAWNTLPKIFSTFDPSLPVLDKLKTMRDVLNKMEELPILGGLATVITDWDRLF